MSSLVQTAAVYTAAVGLLCLVHVLLGRTRPALLDAALGISAIAAVAVTVVDLVGLLSHGGPRELGTHLGYAVTAPVVLPATAGVTRGDRGRWGSACFATACAVLVVVLARLVITGRG